MTKTVAAAIVLLSAAALAHGDAQWIQDDPRHVDDLGIHCCGPTDCERIPPGAVKIEDKGVRIIETGQFFPYTRQGMYHSIDGDLWWCRRAGEVKCIFIPHSGS